MLTQYSDEREAQQHKLQAIVDALADCTLAYPAAGVTEEQVVGIASLWLEDLAAFRPDVITRAIRAHRRTSRFFPSIADAIAACRTIAERDAVERASQLALDEMTGMSHDEQCEFNARKVRDLLSMLERSMGVESPRRAQ